MYYRPCMLEPHLDRALVAGRCGPIYTVLSGTVNVMLVATVARRLGLRSQSYSARRCTLRAAPRRGGECAG